MTPVSSGVDACSLRRLLTDVVGSGPRTADDLSYEQARGAMGRILDGESDPTTLGAFLLAVRWKPNTPEELAGFLDAIRDRASVVEPSVEPVDCGANYDGKRETALLGVAAGCVSAAAGVPVVVHSGDRVPATAGDAYRHVLDALGVETDLAPDASARMVEETGFGFYFQPRVSPAVHALLDRREAMGVRTAINTVETLSNPAAASVHLGSFFHRSFGRRLAETVATSRTLDVERVLLIQGNEGYDDVRPGRTHLVEWTEGAVAERQIDTAAFGLAIDRGDLTVDHVATESAAATESVLAGDRTDALADAVALNAALRIYAGGGADTVDGGLERARSVLADGRAYEVVAALRAFDPGA